VFSYAGIERYLQRYIIQLCIFTENPSFMLFKSIFDKVIERDQLAKLRDRHRDKKIVFATGCYDILQSGHAVFFNQCRQYGDIVVVGVGRDHVISELKGPGRPVNPENNRLYLVAAFQDVDYATLNDTEIAPGKIDFQGVMETLKPDVFILNTDDSAIEEKRALCERNGIELVFVTREVPRVLEPTSTTRIIDKIQFAYRAPLRIDFAGGWTDVPYIMGDKKGYVSNITISPLIELKNGVFNFAGYPRGSGLSTSTAAKLLEMISSRNYNSDSRSISQISEDLFNLENRELNWAIGRQDQYSIVRGGFNCWECGKDYARALDIEVPKHILEEFKKNLVLIHTGASRNAQSAVEEVYQNHRTEKGRDALDQLAFYGKEFARTLQESDFQGCAEIMGRNFRAQIQLASTTTNDYLSEMYSFALAQGACGGKIAGAGGGGAFIFYCEDPSHLISSMKERFVDCFEISFDFHYGDIKKLNSI
jgi:cytidyltransferase-like protein